MIIATYIKNIITTWFHMVERNYLSIFRLYMCVYTLPNFYVSFSSQIILLWNSFYVLSSLYANIP